MRCVRHPLLTDNHLPTASSPCREALPPIYNRYSAAGHPSPAVKPERSHGVRDAYRPNGPASPPYGHIRQSPNPADCLPHHAPAGTYCCVPLRPTATSSVYRKRHGSVPSKRRHQSVAAEKTRYGQQYCRSGNDLRPETVRSIRRPLPIHPLPAYPWSTGSHRKRPTDESATAIPPSSVWDILYMDTYVYRCQIVNSWL